MTTPGAVSYFGSVMLGNITERPGITVGAITDGETGYYDVVVTGTAPTGPVSLFVNGVAIPVIVPAV